MCIVLFTDSRPHSLQLISQILNRSRTSIPYSSPHHHNLGISPTNYSIPWWCQHLHSNWWGYLRAQVSFYDGRPPCRSTHPVVIMSVDDIMDIDLRRTQRICNGQGSNNTTIDGSINGSNRKWPYLRFDPSVQSGYPLAETCKKVIRGIMTRYY